MIKRTDFVAAQQRAAGLLKSAHVVLTDRESRSIEIAELGYRDDGETGAGGWEAAGWLLTDNTVMQRWLVQLIAVAADSITVQRMPVDVDGRGRLTIANLENLDEAMLVVSALAPVTTEAASYSYEITQP